MNFRIVLTIIILSFTTTAHAGYFLSHDKGAIKQRIKSCGAVCSGNPSLVRITEQEYIDSGLRNKKIDLSIVTGSRIVNMTQAEIDARNQAEADAQLQEERDRADKLDFTLEDVIVALVKRINERLPANKITKQEVIDQLKQDKGIQ